MHILVSLAGIAIMATVEKCGQQHGEQHARNLVAGRSEPGRDQHGQNDPDE